MNSLFGECGLIGEECRMKQEYGITDKGCNLPTDNAVQTPSTTDGLPYILNVCVCVCLHKFPTFPNYLRHNSHDSPPHRHLHCHSGNGKRGGMSGKNLASVNNIR